MISPVKVWRNQAQVAASLGKRGKIISFTVIRTGPSGFESQIPYPIIVVQLPNSQRMVGQLVDWNESDLCIGCPVEAILRRVREPHKEGVIAYGIKFRPV